MPRDPRNVLQPSRLAGPGGAWIPNMPKPNISGLPDEPSRVGLCGLDSMLSAICIV